MSKELRCPTPLCLHLPFCHLNMSGGKKIHTWKVPFLSYSLAWEQEIFITGRCQLSQLCEYHFTHKLEFLIACYKLNCIQGASSQCFRRPPFRRFSVSLQCKTIALPFFILNNIHTNTLIHSVILRHSEICSRVKCKITLLPIRSHTDELNRYHKQSTIFHHSQTKRFITNII